MKENNKPLVLHSSWCCGNLAYAICKSQKDGVAIDTGNYCYFFLKLFFLCTLLLRIEQNVSIHLWSYKEQRKNRGLMADSNLNFQFPCFQCSTPMELYNHNLFQRDTNLSNTFGSCEIRTGNFEFLFNMNFSSCCKTILCFLLPLFYSIKGYSYIYGLILLMQTY